MALYRKKPIVVEAFQWTGGTDQIEDPEWFADAIKESIVFFGVRNDGQRHMFIDCFGGAIQVNPGDFVIKYENDMIVPCSPDEFKDIYESA